MKYGFLEFSTVEAATQFFQNMNGKPVTGTKKVYKLNWAAYLSKMGKSGAEINIYVGDLDPSVTEYKLLAFFKEKYPSAMSSKIITDNATKRPKGFGFVNFSNAGEAQRAITDMNGQFFQGKPIKVSNAVQKSKEEVKETAEESETLASQRLKLYEEFYTMMNDPILKAEYEKELQKSEGLKKPTIKQSL